MDAPDAGIYEALCSWPFSSNPDNITTVGTARSHTIRQKSSTALAMGLPNKDQIAEE
jgi:hypothetical protein